MRKGFRLSRVTVAVLAASASLLSGTAYADGPQFRFSGYGTVAATHFSDDNSDFVGNIFQPDGAGHTKSVSFEPDSMLGAQLDAVFNDKLSAVLQVVVQHQYDDKFRPAVEWANVKYQFTPEFSMRLGRIAAPSYLLSESRFVGYANPWLRPPLEAYSVLSITSNDGIDATYRRQFGSVTNTLQVYYGTSTAKLPTGKVKSNPAWGLNNVVEMGDLTMRIGYTNVKLDADIPSVDPLLGGLAQTAAQTAIVLPAVSAQATGLLNKYKLDGMSLSAVALGASYNPSNWFLMSEVVLFKGDGFLSDSTSWYVSSGYRFGNFTPYITHSRTKAHIDHETGMTPVSPGIVALNDGLNQTLNQFTPTQYTNSIGLRWDFRKNMAFKTQYDFVKIGDGSNGRSKTFPGLTPDKNPKVFSVAIDFVF